MTFSRTGRWFFAGLALAASLAGSVSPALGDYSSFDRRYREFSEHRANLEQMLQNVDSHGSSPGGLRAWASRVVVESYVLSTDVFVMSNEIEYGGNAYKDNPTTPCGSIELKLYGPYGRGFGYQAMLARIQDEMQSIKAAMAKLDARQNDLNHAILAGKNADRGFPIHQWSVETTAALKDAQRAYDALLAQANVTSGDIAKLNATLNGPKCQTGGKTTASPSPLPSRSPSPSPKPAPSASSKLGPSPAPSPSGGCPSGYIRTTTGGCVPYRPWMN